MAPKKGKATIHDIAGQLNITASTVSRALNNNPRISDATKKLVHKMARQLNYQPNNIASALRSGKSKLIGVIVPTTNRNFFSSVARGIDEVANKLNYQVIITQSYDSYEKEVLTIDALLSARVDGIIASYSKTTTNFDHFKRVIEKGIPLVLFDRFTSKLDVCHILIDDYQGAYKIVEHLIGQGYRRIAHFTSSKKINIYQERLRGYQDALKDNDIAIDPELIVESNLQLEDGRNSAKHLFDHKISFDAIFSSSDYAAMGAMAVVKEHGLKIPSDVGMAGFGNEPFTSFTEPPLTTVDQLSVNMGHVAAETFFEQLQEENKKGIAQKTVLNPEVIFRGSSIRKPKK